MAWKFPTLDPVIKQIRISQLENKQIGKAPSFLFQANVPTSRERDPDGDCQSSQRVCVKVSGGATASFDIFETHRKFSGWSPRRYGKRFYFIGLDFASSCWQRGRLGARGKGPGVRTRVRRACWREQRSGGLRLGGLLPAWRPGWFSRSWEGHRHHDLPALEAG